ncbi:protein-disulfide reductase DsbD [Thalassotalea sp. PLHSN55]|uniref:protein-disulfide reductase DsbD n=1 Tax=Thalassotalea sp. PLHSN55 TaxID=3435888 RepID=UPI003F84EAA0
MKRFLNILSVVFVLLSFFPIASQAQTSLFDSSSSSLFSNDDEFLTVEQAFEFEFYQQENVVTVSFDIEEGYYLYRHQFKFSAENADFTPVELPIGEDHHDEFFGTQQVFRDSLTFNVNIEKADRNASLTIKYQGCADKGLCYPPKRINIPLDMVDPASAQQAVLTALSDSEQAEAASTAASQSSAPQSEQHRLAQSLQNDSLLWVLIAFFFGGLLLSFTPCVFPMYPILTGIIVGQGDKLTNKNAFMLSFAYVQGMAITYTLLGVVVALAGAQFQAMFQHPAVLIALSILFIFLALSMFGVFNLALPASWQNKLNNISNKQQGGSLAGVVVMGAISGLVASPCTTAPLTGALLYISQTGDIVIGASALYALSLGMGLPLLVLGSSGGKLLPKAGAWMNIIKNVFGLLLLAVPVFLLERFLSEQISQILWAILILASASYFYVANQNSNKNFWFGVRSLVIFLALFVGANLLYQTVFPSQNTAPQATTEHGFVHVSNLAELEAEISAANSQGKTVMVDLYADWCIACKEFEKYTFPKPEVQTALKNSVLIQVDMTDFNSPENNELSETYQVLGLPSILFFDLSGDELSKQRVTGFMDAPQFSQHVQATFN